VGRSISIILLCGALGSAMACSRTPEPEGTAVEYGKVCALENNGKRVNSEGYLGLGSSIFCSGKSGDVTCRLDFKEQPDSKRDITAYVTEGTGANQMEKVPDNYKSTDLKLRADDSSMISPSDRVKISGDVISMNVGPNGENSCSITVKKIERR
jgi:hypothetical protein